MNMRHILVATAVAPFHTCPAIKRRPLAAPPSQALNFVANSRKELAAKRRNAIHRMRVIDNAWRQSTNASRSLPRTSHPVPGSFPKESDIEGQLALLPYSHYLRQAWSELTLSGVLCVDGRPAVYLCGGARFSNQQKRDHHRFVWNQGLVPLLIFLTPSQVEVHSTRQEAGKGLQQANMPLRCRFLQSDPGT